MYRCVDIHIRTYRPAEMYRRIHNSAKKHLDVYRPGVVITAQRKYVYKRTDTSMDVDAATDIVTHSVLRIA